MIQMGDPTGTGSGGESAWGKPFKDEISNKLRHEGGGVLSMANSGPNSNNSQFFLTFKTASHLDGKHTIFGRVVGGLDTLRKLEAVPTDKDDRPLESVSLLGGTIFVNPYTDVDAKIKEQLAREADPKAHAAEAAAKASAEDGQAWFNHDAPSKPVAHRDGIGKYIAPQHLAGGEGASAAGSGGAAAAASASASASASARSAAALAAAAAAAEPPRKKARAGGGFGNFSSW
jgi:peptidyl-prolyl cis-trans isomerase-like protein 2